MLQGNAHTGDRRAGLARFHDKRGRRHTRSSASLTDRLNIYPKGQARLRLSCAVFGPLITHNVADSRVRRGSARVLQRQDHRFP
jgi:hypothetical protein